MRFHGPVIYKDGLSRIVLRLNDIIIFKTPETKTEVLGVLGMICFNQTYISNFYIQNISLT